MQNILEFLFKTSQVDGLIDNDLAAMLESCDEDTESKTSSSLESALKSIGIDAEVECCGAGCKITASDRNDFADLKTVLTDADCMHSLAAKGWVAAPAGDTSLANGEPSFEIHFVSIDTAECGDKDKPSEDCEAILKKAREFAMTKTDQSETNPVEHDTSTGNDLSKVKVGKPADGKQPEGSIKDSAESIVQQYID